MASGSEEQQVQETKNIKFKQFDIIESSPTALRDHHYKSEVKTNPTSNIPNHIAKEWKILKKNLPESIYVRVYEERIDLLRAAIIGPPGTPYHDGLFFFDICLGKNYPSVPPKVYYHSHGYRLNPNLYNSGRVCLSVINTWFGNGIERWVPGSSTILQVLVSIQGLVLNDKPYFNEPGNSIPRNNTSKNWVKKYMSYNKEAFIMSCKTLLHKLNNPPYGFKDLVYEHCNHRGAYLLAAIKDYHNGGSEVGRYLQGDASPVVASRSSKEAKALSVYKSNLERMHKDIVEAFSRHGILASDNVVELAKLEEEKVGETESDGKKKKAKRGIIAKIIHKFKKIIG